MKRKVDLENSTSPLCLANFFAVLVTLISCSPSAHAYEIEIGDERYLQIHGSFSQGYIQTDRYNWLDLHSESGELQFNDLLLNAQMNITDSLRIGGQIQSRDFGGYGNNDLEVDWAYLDWTRNQKLSIRGGRVKMPFGLYGDSWDLDVARTPVFLPVTVYIPYFRDVLTSIDGLNVYGSISLQRFGDLEYTFMGGKEHLGKDNSVTKFTEYDRPWDADDKVDAGNVYAGRLIWNTPLEGLRLSAFYSYFNEPNTDVTVNTPFFGLSVGDKLNFSLGDVQWWSFSAEYSRGDWVFSTELARIDVKVSLESVFPPSKINYGGGYIQAMYQWNSKWSSAMSVGVFYEDWHERWDVDDARGHNVTSVSTRFDPTEWMTLKAEIQYRDGPEQIYFENNPGLFPDLAEDYWLFATKVTVHF